MPLMYACAKNEADIVKTLRKRGADSAFKDKLGRTAAERAHGEDNPCMTP
jgi:ankyrin repeat protein